ncbi:MAG: hypothetical protein IT384_15670 [Deltaproteobacteria bacterium]|nr:hypothetical protein [Deltaproteobacteria bacterium]
MILLLAAIGGCSGEDSTPSPVPLTPRIEIAPGGVILIPSSPSRKLTARVLDRSSGQPIEAEVTWESSAPSSIRVGADGTVTAVETVGSAVITARSGEARGEILVIAVEPAAGAVVVRDQDIVGEPVAKDASAPFGVGFQYDVTLLGVPPPSAGAILFADGEKPVAGRVIATSGAVVTLEVVPIDQLFARLDLSAKLDLSVAPYSAPAGLDEAFVTEDLPNGAIRMTQRAESILTSSRGLRPQWEFEVGPFECESSITGVAINLAQSELTFTPALSFEVEWNELQRKIVVAGEPKVELKVTPTLSAAISGELECKLVFRTIHIPVPGPLGLLIGAVVPLGAGFQIGGAIPLAEVGAEFKSTIGASLRMGFDCNPDCEPVQSLMRILDGKVEPKLPAALEGFEIEGEFMAFLFADLEGGARFSSTLRVEAIEGKAGLKLETKLASEQTQADDGAFKAEYGAAFEASIGAGSDFSRFLELVSVNVAALELKLVFPLGGSPTGTVRADRESFAAGETVTFDVTLEPGSVDFPIIGYNVVAVRIYRRSEGSLVLANEVVATAGQTQFRLPWAATVSGSVEGNFVAFASTRVLPVLRTEIGDAEAGMEQTGSFTFEERRVFETGRSDMSVTSTTTETEVLRGSLSLRLMFRTDTSKQFEIVGGSVQYTEQYDFVQVSTDVTLGACNFNERIEDHYSGSGTAGATGAVQIELAEGAAYQIQVDVADPFTVNTSGVWTARYEFLGSQMDCRTDSTDEYQRTHQSYAETGFIGTTGSIQDRSLSGTTTEVQGDATVTKTWSLTLN